MKTVLRFFEKVSFAFSRILCAVRRFLHKTLLGVFSYIAPAFCFLFCAVVLSVCYDLLYWAAVAEFNTYKLPSFSWKIYLILLLGVLVLNCVILALYTQGVSKWLNKRERPIPFWVVATNLFASLLICACLIDFNGTLELYFIPTYMVEIIDDASRTLITPWNEAQWRDGACMIYLCLLTTVFLVSYLSEKKNQEYIKERERLHREEREANDTV